MTLSYALWLRQFVGKQKLLLTGTGALIRGQDGRVLLQQRRDNQLWDVPGGMQELGETAADTVRREVYEEIGLHVAPKRLLGLYTSTQLDLIYPNGDPVQFVLPCFECEIIAGTLKKQEDEVLAIDWFDIDSVPELTPFARAVLRDAKRFRGEAFFKLDEDHDKPRRNGDVPSSYVHWLRQFVGHEKLILAGAAGMIRDAQGRVLLQQRRDNGLWGFPGGLQELGESVSDAVVREFREEVGLEVVPKRLIGIYTSPELDRTYPNGDQVQMFISFFESEAVGGELKMQEEEVLDIGWFDLDNLPPMIKCCEMKACDAKIFKGEAFFR